MAISVVICLTVGILFSSLPRGRGSTAPKLLGWSCRQGELLFYSHSSLLCKCLVCKRESLCFLRR